MSDSAKPKSVLFVCTGNICRSPMAEALFRAATQGDPSWQIASAGTSALFGQAASEPAVAALKEKKIDLSTHLSQPLSEELIAGADYIFAMTHGHLEALQIFFPGAEDRAFLLRDFIPGLEPELRDVPDPIGMSLTTYRECRDVIAEAIPYLLQFMAQPQTTIRPVNENTATVRLAIGADHGGFYLKQALVKKLQLQGYNVSDFGAHSEASVDYPDFAAPVCEALQRGRADMGILICKSGLGMSMTANHFSGIRAALVHDESTAALSREHNDANVLCLGAAHLEETEAWAIVRAWLNTPFSGGRHAQRVEKLHAIDSPLAQTDPDIFEAIQLEESRQSDKIELIASENFASPAVREAQGSILTNKYAEGYPGKRWYGGCEHVDVVESLAIERAKSLFQAEHANVQPHSGSQANTAVYFASLEVGDRILTMDLSHGGHLTHGNKANFSGRFFDVVHYGVSESDERIDYDSLAKLAKESRPKMITAGASAYPRVIDFAKMREIADSVGALLFVDMAHIAGLVAAGVHPSPVPYADFVTTTTHKSLRGPRGGLILCGPDWAKKIDSQVFPGIQGGPLMHVIAAKAVCFLEASQPGFVQYQNQIVRNAKALAARLTHNGLRLVSGGTDNHLMLVDLRPLGLVGSQAEVWLDEAGITVNKNAIPYDTTSVFKGGGIRIGTPAVTTRGMKEDQMMDIADLITEVLRSEGNEEKLAALRQEVGALTQNYPVFAGNDMSPAT